MAIPASIAKLYEAGDAWLADCSAHPTLVRAAWSAEALAPIASGKSWLVAETPLLAAMKALNRLREEHRGPVLTDPEKDKAWWLVPLDAAEALAGLRRMTVHVPGWSLHCPPTGWHIESRFWLSRPDGSGHLTDPAVLAAAYGPGGHRQPAEAS